MPPEDVAREFEERRGLRAHLRAEGFQLGPVPSPPASVDTIADYARMLIYLTGVVPPTLTAESFDRLKRKVCVTGHEDHLHAELTLSHLLEVYADHLAELGRDSDRFYAEREGVTVAEFRAAFLRFEGISTREWAARHNREAAGLRMRALLLRRPSRTAAPALGRMARPRARGRSRRRGLRRTRGGCRSPGRPSDPEPALGTPPPLPGGVR